MTVRDVGFYAPAYSIGVLIMIVPKVLGVVLPPVVSKLIDAGKENDADRILQQSMRFFLFLSIPFCIGAMLLGQPIVSIYTTKEIAAASWKVVPIVALGSIFLGLSIIASTRLLVGLQTAALFRVSFVTAFLNVVLNILLIKTFQDIVWAAAASALCYLVGLLLIVRHLVSQKIFTMPKWSALLLPLFGSTTMTAFFFFLKPYWQVQDIQSTAVLLLASVMVYFCVILGFPEVRHDIKQALQAKN